MQERIKDLIIQLKHVKEREGLTNADIVRMVEEKGDYVSMSTVARVMADGSEETNFRYRESIKPIASVLLELDAAHLEGLSDEERAAKDIILLKEMELREKDQQIEALTEKMAAAEADARRRIDYLKEQIVIYQEEIIRKDAQIAARDSQIATRDVSLRMKDEMIANITNNIIEVLTAYRKIQEEEEKHL